MTTSTGRPGPVIAELPTGEDAVGVDHTSVRVALVGGRPRVRLRSGLLRAQQVHTRPGWSRVALVASRALLLGGDQVRLDVHVEAGARLELFEVAGTVAYHGRGLSCGWCVVAEVETGGELIMAGEPFVVADGADVTRILIMEVAAGARAVVRETLVLGRTGEQGGRLVSHTFLDHEHRALLREDQVFEPGLRSLPGVLGHRRVLDSLTVIGADRPAVPAGATAFRLLDDTGTVVRWVGFDAAASPLHRLGAGQLRTLLETR